MRDMDITSLTYTFMFVIIFRRCRSVTFRRDYDFDELTCPASKTVFSAEMVQSEIQCSFLCGITSSCVGAFYLPQSNNCVCCSTFSKNELSVLEGTHSYGQVCLDPPNLENAILQPGVVTTGVVRTYKFDCPAGMIGYGAPEVTCLSNLKWSQPEIGCREIRNCSDVKQCDNSYDDGEYWLFPEILENKKVKIFCSGMGDAAPSEYITVDENRNYGFNAGRTASAEKLTRYKKIRVDIKTLEIIRADHKFTDPSSSSFDYAQGASCRCNPRCNPLKGYFNISTEGTGFKFNKQVTWVKFGWGSAIAEFDRNEDRTIISARGGGYCGGCRPDGALYVEIDEHTVLDDETATLPKCT